MFYITKHTHEKECEIGEVCMSLADFSGIPAGTKGVITDIYDEGVMVTWEGRVIHSPEFQGRAMVDDILKLMRDSGQFRGMAAHGWLSDGFSVGDLEYLAFRTAKHPTR